MQHIDGRRPILVIEDDAKTSALIARYLEREGFGVHTAPDGLKGLALARRYRPQLVILDLMLPGMDGWEVCRQLRQTSDVPLIMLTARGDEVDRVAGLTLGADDYVVKPFSPRELVARVQSILRRTGPRPSRQNEVLTVGTLVMDTVRRTVHLSDRPLALTPHEYALLKRLMASPGRVFTRDELLDTLYPNGSTVVIDRVVDVHIGKLRHKIEANPAAPEVILTVRGVGYRCRDTTP